MAFAIRDNKETRLQKDILAETMPLVAIAPGTNKLELVRPGEPGYDTYRKTMNTTFDRTPGRNCAVPQRQTGCRCRAHG